MLIFGYRAYGDLYVSVREGDWKALAYRSGKTELYNIKKDIAESNELSEQEPEKLKELIGKLIDWEKQMKIEEYPGVQ
ncbi:hypothetical protein E9993_08680 [Labilibacter sediminis]|nr:hypothetical protein E9993_08680 [Labilibacter sediminis]